MGMEGRIDRKVGGGNKKWRGGGRKGGRERGKNRSKNWRKLEG